MKIRNVEEAGGYFVKYLQKDEKEWNHKVKSTRNLGLTELKNYLQRLTIEEAMALSWRPPKYEKFIKLQRLVKAPISLIRKQVKDQLFYLRFLQGEINPAEELFTKQSVYLQMLDSIRDGERPDRMSAVQRYDWVTEFIKLPKEYNHEDQVEAFTRMGKWFERQPNYVQRQSMPGRQTSIL